MVNPAAVTRSDEELIQDFRQGKEDAFDELVRRHMERAVQIARIQVGNYEDAKDLSQEAFVKAHRSLKSFQGKSSFSTWFYRILMNTVKDHFRSRKGKSDITWQSQESMDYFFESRIDERTEASSGALERELNRQMSEVVQELPPQQKNVFIFRFTEDLSLREIAQVMNLSEGTVKATLHFAIRKFKDKMAPYLDAKEA